jgi:SAM-dependent methyltransferase
MAPVVTPVELPARAPNLDPEGALLAARFSERELRVREGTWRVLCADFLQRYVAPGATVVDVGAGDGLFLRHIRAGRRIAVDVAASIEALAREGIEVRIAPATAFATGLEGSADVVFMSNLLEHLSDRGAVLAVLRECRRALAPGGRLLVLQPNIRYAGAAYWDFFDHQIPLTDASLAEALVLAGLEVVERRARFLPYSAASLPWLPPAWVPALVRVYLRLPWLWRIFGAQCFVVARTAEPARP